MVAIGSNLDEELQWVYPKASMTQIRGWPDGQELLLSCSLTDANGDFAAMNWTKGGQLLASSVDWRLVFYL
jgi:hypothetical protein